MKKVIAFLCLALLTTLIAMGCSSQVNSEGESAPAGEQQTNVNEEPRKLRMASWSQPIAEQSNIYLAEQQGWFQEAGIDFEYIPGAGGGDAVKNIIAGNADMAFTNVEAVLLAAEKGAKLKIIYNIYPENIFNLVSLKEQGITSVQDLKGKAVGVYSLSSGTYQNLLVLLHSAGLREEDVNIVEAGVLNFGPLMNKQIVATAATDTGLYDARQKGLGEVNVIEVRDVLNTPSDVFVVTEETFQEKRELLVDFLQVYRDSVAYTMDQPQEAAQAAVKQAIDGQDEARNLEIIKIRNQTSTNSELEEKGLGWLNMDVLQQVEDAYVKIGLLQGPVNIKNMATNELVQELE